MPTRTVLSGLGMALGIQTALLVLMGLASCDDSLPPGSGQIRSNPPQSYQPVYTAQPTSPFPQTSAFGATPLPASPFPNTSPFPATPPPASPFPNTSPFARPEIRSQGGLASVALSGDHL